MLPVARTRVGTATASLLVKFILLSPPTNKRYGVPAESEFTFVLPIGSHTSLRLINNDGLPVVVASNPFAPGSEP